MPGSNKKMFTAERKRLEQRGGTMPAIASPGQSGAAAKAENALILSSINMLHQDLRELKEMLTPSESEPNAVDDRHNKELREKLEKEHEELETRQAELNMLRTEVQALANSIHDTKREIAALRPPNSDDDRIMVVANELDAVVEATEGATDSILENMEAIENHVQRIQAQERDSATGHIADEILDHVTKVFEACNFQDITGQRITKVVNTLKFVEERIDKMIEIWGRDTFEHLPTDKADDHADDDAKLLNGPQLEGKGISQADIDALFD